MKAVFLAVAAALGFGVGSAGAGTIGQASADAHRRIDITRLQVSVAGRVTVPARIGPVEFGTLGAMIAVRCPHEFDPLMRRAGGLWEPGSRRWLIERQRIGPVLRELRRITDPCSGRPASTWTSRSSVALPGRTIYIFYAILA